jgi:antitoxin CptB
MTRPRPHWPGPTSDEPMLADSEYNRIYWHSRRGMLELDLILLPFVEKHLRQLPAEDVKSYVGLLEQEDQDLYTWLIGRLAPPTPLLSRIIGMILSSHYNTGD